MQKRSGAVSSHPNTLSARHIVRGLLVALIFASLGTLILTYQFSSSNIVNLDNGDVVPEDILAPSQIVYISDIETEAARERARNSISTVYSRPDPKVAREQVLQLRKIFDYIDAVRADPFGSLAEKSGWLTAISNLTLSDIVVGQILGMNEQAWEDAKQDALVLLDEAMRAEIRETQVLTTRRQLPTRLALDTPDNQANVIVDITEDLIKPNTFPDVERTEADRATAVNGVSPVSITYEQNELIISGGQIVGPKEMEALEVLGLQRPKFRWIEDLIAPAGLMLMTTIIISTYLVQFSRRVLIDHKRLFLLTFLLLAFIATAKFMIPNSNPIIPFLYPVAALTMMIVILIDVQLAFILTTILAFLAGFIAPETSNAIVIYLILSGWTGVLALGKNQRVNNLLWASVYVGVVNVGIILVFNISSNPPDMADTGILLLTGLLNGVFSAGLASIGLFVIGSVVGITTSIQLMDLGRPTHPLLRQLLLKAPGTYHHSLMVSNMGEQAAERVGADALLVRVMAYYHDIGKMQRPYFFIENQPEGVNVHEKLDPQISAQIIISHVKDGLDLANKYRLPQVIKDGIAQHQGTGMVKYFYYEALQTAKEKEVQINEADFRYPGPRPQNKENAILMLADISETTVRALKPGSTEEIDEIVQKLIADKLSSGELNECDLTIADLHEIRSAFVDILQGVHHPRIKYPEQIQAEAEKAAQTKEAAPAPEKPAQPETTGGNNATTPATTPATLPTLADSPTRPANLIRRE